MESIKSIIKGIKAPKKTSKNYQEMRTTIKRWHATLKKQRGAKLRDEYYKTHPKQPSKKKDAIGNLKNHPTLKPNYKFKKTNFTY